MILIVHERIYFILFRMNERWQSYVKNFNIVKRNTHLDD